MIAQGMFKSQGLFSVLVSRGYSWRYCSRVSELGGYLSKGHSWQVHRMPLWEITSVAKTAQRFSPRRQTPERIVVK